MDDDMAQEEVLRAAAQLFYEQGIRAVGIDQIRDASGVSLKRLYKLFPAKDQIAEEVLRRREEAFFSQLPGGTPHEAILGFFDSLHAWFSEPGYRGCPFLNAFAEASSPGVVDVALRQKQRLQRHFEELVGPELAGQLLVLANGAMATSAVLGSAEPARHAKAAAEVLLGQALR
jgi:AcrR family transcriptional regulator